MTTNMQSLFISQHRYLYQNLTDTLIDLSPAQLYYVAPLLDLRPLCEVALHAYRPLLAVACVSSAQSWPARVPIPATTEEFVQLLDTMRMQIDALVADLPEEAWGTSIELPWEASQTVAVSLHQAIAHGMFHIGIIHGIRASGGFPLPPEDAKPARGKN